MTSDPDPTFEELLDWMEGRLDPDMAADVARAAAAGDDRTTEAIRWIQAFKSESRNQQLLAPPPELRPRLRRLFAVHVSAGSPGLRTLLAQLSFDSRVEGQLAGVRSAAEPASGEPFQLTARAGEFDVVLDVTPLVGEARIDGQVLADRVATGSWLAAAEYPGGQITAEPGDDLGCFALRSVPLDIHRLVLRNSEVVIVVDLPPIAGS